MHSIHNFSQLQIFFSANKGYNKAPISDFHDNKNDNIPEFGSEWKNFLEKTDGGPNALHTIPRFDDTASIVKFAQELEGVQFSQEQAILDELQKNDDEPVDIGEPAQTDISFERQKEKTYQDIVLAYNLAQKYIRDQPRSYRKHMIDAEINDINDFIRHYRSFHKQSQTNLNTKIFFCIFLKKVFAFLKIIRSQHFQIDYENKEIDLRNRRFIHSIIEIFNNEKIFDYSQQNSEKFSQSSERARGKIKISSREFGFEGFFGVKSLDRIVGKMSRDNRYTAINAMKDLHRMRIKVDTPEAALHIGKILFEQLGENLEIRNKGNFISQEEFELFSNSYLTESPTYQQALGKAIETKEKTKTISSDRQELRLARRTINSKYPAIEIQIVLNNNFNETGGYAHHSIYEMKGLIEEIIHDKMYITLEHIKEIIKFYAKKDIEANNGKSTIPFGEEQILNHILSLENFLVEIVQTEKTSNNNTKNRAYSTNAVLGHYTKNYPITTTSINIARVKDTFNEKVLEKLNGTIIKK